MLLSSLLSGLVPPGMPGLGGQGPGSHCPQCPAHGAEKGQSCHLMSGNDKSACSSGETSLSVSCFTDVTGVQTSDAMSLTRR